MADPDIKTLAAGIVAVYVGNNTVGVADLPALIRSTYMALVGTGSAVPATPDRPPPAVPVKKSVTPDAIICLECGKGFKMLKRHLGTDHDLTVDGYRAKWSLPKDYPVVAPSYAAHRSQLAKDIGLGLKPKAAKPPK